MMLEASTKATRPTRQAAADAASTCAPIALFVYNRLEQTLQTLDALKRNVLAAESDLFIYSDAPRNPAAADAVRAVRAGLNDISGFKSVIIVERETNFGLANSIIDGVTSLCERFGRVIVLEDDLVTSPEFLRYMNSALEKYAGHPSVYSVTGYSFTNEDSDVDPTYFLMHTSSWGWATWEDKWKFFERNRITLAEKLQSEEFRKKFDFNDSYQHSRLAYHQIIGKSDSWAIYWHFCVLQAGGLTLYPAKSLVKNIGFDGSGTHREERNDSQLLWNVLPELTDKIYEDQCIRRKAERAIRLRAKTQKKRGLLRRLASRARKSISNAVLIRLSQTRQRLKLCLHRKDVGRNTYIDKSAQILGWNSISIGHSSSIGEDSWLNVNQRIPGVKNIVIGNNCWIGKGNFLSPALLISIGDYCMTGMGCKFLGANHRFDNPLLPYISTGTTADKVIRLGANVWLGVDVTVVGNVSIGYGSIVGASSLVNKDIPPFSIATGNPAKVVKRFDFILQKWIPVSDYTVEHEKSIPSEAAYLAILKSSHPVIMMPLQAASRSFGDML